MLSDIRIAQNAKILPVEKIAAKLRLPRKYLIPHGKYIAKIDLDLLGRLKDNPRAKYVLVSAITPTPLGEGKTVTTIGLAMALNRLKRLSSVCIRQPSLGPVFGIKGSAGGGGYSQVLPREDFDLHFTGDAHAVGLAHNVTAAFLDNSLYRNNPFGIDPNKVYWRRVMDIGDRFLRKVKIGEGLHQDAFVRDSGFDITASSEIMAILALSQDARDLRRRLSRVVIAEDLKGNPVTTEDIKVAGLMAVLLKDAIRPNLIQTIENTPCFVHTGPFANIAHGNSSIIQDKLALALSEFVVTEAGFGADCGAEKFFDIKCRTAGLKPDVAVVVCSVRALKAHGGICKVVPGKPLEECLKQENLEALEKGMANLKKQIGNISLFGIPVVVAVNKFDTDTEKEIDLIRKSSLEFGARDCQVSEVWQKGSKGGVELAKSVIRLSGQPKKFNYLYALEAPLKEKIRAIATKVYGAGDVEYSAAAEEKIRVFNQRGWNNLPVCMAKTHLSLSHDPELKGAPSGFILPVRDIRAALGAGFIIPVCGRIQTMPGLPSHPRGEDIDIDEKGNIIGLA
ncbi:MAG: formate--tetrahydrofolate ligase [Candidatus Omnitrophica bacterium]|nr:formate--tetrahydrofolate ligase [Candidatus Omnitrophota bacterium]